MSEELFDAKPTAFYELYRVENNKIVEHGRTQMGSFDYKEQK